MSRRERDDMRRTLAEWLASLGLILGLIIPLSAGLPYSQNAQALAINEYRIGAKDLLEITVFESARAQPDGPRLRRRLDHAFPSRQGRCSGLTAQELEKKLAGSPR